MKKTCFFLLTLAGLVSCSKADSLYPEDDYLSGSGVYKEASPSAPGDSGGQGQGQAGVVTAGEWNDLENWAFWSTLMDGQTYGDKADVWSFYTANRVAVEVSDPAGSPVIGATVELQRMGKTIWTARTDVYGKADLFADMYQKGENADPQSLVIKIDGVAQDAAVQVSNFDPAAPHKVNSYVLTGASAPGKVVDIAFVVDATGSMGDEIEFLKSDLEDIIGQVSKMQASCTFRTAALFYRDEGDEYITRSSDFSENLSVTRNFVKAQRAGGGGDYPEAVHTALEKTLQDLSWNESARSRLVFMLLDAPAHQNDAVRTSLHTSVENFARNGIKIIPVAASGVDKDTEFMCRFFAIATGGTYVFITNDSGVGNDHIEASVGDYKVEKLNDLIVRLIAKYI